MATIAGGIAKAYYKEIPQEISKGVYERLPQEFIEILSEFQTRMQRN